MKMIFVVFIFIFNTAKSQEPPSKQLNKITILEINDSVLEGYYYIKFRAPSLKTGILVSRKEDNNCGNKLEPLKKYQMQLELLTTTETITYPTFRLYINDIYIDEILTFPKKYKVYKSPDLTGLC